MFATASLPLGKRKRSNVKILMFGRLADVAGAEIRLDDSEGCTVAELRDRLAQLHPNLGPALSKVGVRACVDDTVVPENHELTGDTEGEFLPAVSGG